MDSSLPPDGISPWHVNGEIVLVNDQQNCYLTLVCRRRRQLLAIFHREYRNNNTPIALLMPLWRLPFQFPLWFLSKEEREQ